MAGATALGSAWSLVHRAASHAPVRYHQVPHDHWFTDSFPSVRPTASGSPQSLVHRRVPKGQFDGIRFRMIIGSQTRSQVSVRWHQVPHDHWFTDRMASMLDSFPSSTRNRSVLPFSSTSLKTGKIPSPQVVMKAHALALPRSTTPD